MSEELKPCPFCGGEGKLYDDYISERDEHRWQVWHVCDNGPEGESAGYGKACHTSIDTPWFKSREKAVEAWNTRTPEQAIAATLGDGEYESHMDELLCRLTNGKWSKSRSYSVDFMVSCVDEAYDDAALGGGECEFVGNAKYPPKCSSCGWQAGTYDCKWLGDEYEYDGKFCKECGAKVKAVKR